MAKIADNTLNTFVDGKVVRDVDLNPKMEIIKTAINANADDIAARYTKAESDAKMNTAVGSRIVAAGTAFPAGPYLDGQEFYRTDLKQLFNYDLGMVAWQPTGDAATLFTPVTLSRGQQAVTTTRRTPFAVLNLKGRTLVNLLGRVGNMQATGKNVFSAVTEAADTTNYVNGTQSLKYTASGTTAVEHYAVLGSAASAGGSAVIGANKYYLVVGAIRPNVGQAVIRWITFDSANAAIADSGIASPVTDTAKFTNKYFKFQAGANATKIEVRTQILNASGISAYIPAATAENASFGAVRVYEVDQATYNKIGDGVTTGYQTADDLDKLFPYVDDVKHIANPYIIKQGKNFVTPVADTSTWSLHANAHATTPYTISHVATASGETSTLTVPALPSQQYTLSTATNGFTTTYFSVDSAGVETALTATNGTVTTLASTLQLRIKFASAAAATYTLDKPMLNLGNTALPFEPQNQDVLFIPTSVASSVDGTVYDTLYERDGAIWKNKRFQDMVLDGSLPWGTVTDYAGGKRILLPTSNIPNVSAYYANQQAVKYDGKIIQQTSNASLNVNDYTYIDANNFAIFLADADTGWGDAYTAVTVDEIKAYFNGWKASTVDAGGKPTAWVSLGDATAAPTQTLAYVSTNRAPKTVPYKLTYQLATEQPEVILSEGQISLHDGLNQVEFGEGLIVREVANPATASGWGDYVINRTDQTISQLKFRVNKFLAVYKNGVIDTKWRRGGTTNAYGNDSMLLPTSQFDPTAEYTVSYYALDKYAVSTNVVTLDGQYAANLKTVVDQNVQNIADTKRQVDALAITVDDMRTKVSEEPWIAPTLLNGWLNFDPTYSNAGYMKDSLGFVHLIGIIKSGTATNGTALFNLPAGYRPAKRLTFATDSNAAYGRIDILPSGDVIIVTGTNTSLTLDIPPFRAEQ